MLKNSNPLCAPAIRIYSISALFYSIVYFVLLLLPFWAAAHGANDSQIGLMLGVAMVSSMIARPVVGRLIDRVGTGTLFVTAVAGLTLSLSGYFVGTFLGIVAARVVQGLVAACFSTCMELIIIDLLTPQARGRGLSLFSLATVIPTMVVPSLALMLKQYVPILHLFVGCIGMAVLTLVLAVALRISGAIRVVGKRRSSSTRIRGTWRRPTLVVPSAIMLLCSVANGAVYSFLPRYLEAQRTHQAALYFLIQTTALVGLRFLGKGRIPSDGRLSAAIVGGAAVAAAIGTTLLASAPGTAGLAAAGLCLGGAFAVLYPTLLTFVSFHVPEDSRGFLLALFIGAADCGFAMGSLVMGFVADALSYPAVFLGSAACCVAALAITVVWSVFQRRISSNAPLAMETWD